MKRISCCFLVLVLCSFTAKIEANKKKPTFNTEYVASIPKLDPADPRWDWMDEQIEKDFENVPVLSKAKVFYDYRKVKKTPVRCYEILKGRVQDLRDHITDFLEAVLARYPLPDLVFLYYEHDIVRCDFFSKYPINTPLFCSAKAPYCQGKIIHFIDWYYHITDAKSGWNRMIYEIDEMNSKSSWEMKAPILFWRGGTTDSHGMGASHFELQDFPRGRLVQMSLDYPNLVDARFTWLANQDRQYHFPQSHLVSIPEHLDYKYQIAMDGETATYPGYQWRLYSGCLTFKQDSLDTMWYYGPLKPYVHYIPVSTNLEDLLEKILWAVDHDEKAQEIAENARNFAKENLMPEHMLLYGYKVLLKYASKIQK